MDNATYDFSSVFEDPIFATSFDNKSYNFNEGNYLSDPSTVLQVTLSTESDLLDQDFSPVATTTPIDIPKSQSSCSYNIPLNNQNFEALLPTSYTSSVNNQDLTSYTNSLSNMSRSPFIAPDDLASWFDELAVRSPSAGSIYSSHSPLQIGSPSSPLCFSGSNTPNHFLASSPNSHLLGSPLIQDPVLSTSPLAQNYNLAYLSPTLRPTLFRQNNKSPICSPRTRFLPLTQHLSQQQAKESTTDFVTSPYLPEEDNVPVATADGFDELSDLLFGNVQDLELFPAVVLPPSSPQPQPEIKKARNNKTKRGTKIHRCPYCNHTSNRANNMREHVQIHNPNRPKPFCCKICDRAFARKHDMKRHYLSCKKYSNKPSM
ncbi:hypothetical protein G6F57_004073 [Rhizopus arrhizus]|uniref:C2H2-type domain-containing protein n=1 Tax=Rhizopus oryzae TaxID=64495 RepID=A0A9P6XKZ5_RHIOR|nr:hypothetical protein G6F23_003683 [Rhizopus arrhizus]KAG1414973.1 hypothetical protein G6F58_006702 [Rhizopus delemar]KAG0768634.1 hypothetical protein G6F24_001779 [Rhizopus arrhizus]KAG0797215.1 hypothetical protein G6F21_000689 [Rhizopus arrhizus]KAG0816636.1 hypothetical protein G6F20_003051 [Rhizopus arrhizus]